MNRLRRGMRRARQAISRPAVFLFAWFVSITYWICIEIVWQTSRVEAYGMARAVTAINRDRNMLVGIWHDNIAMAPRCWRVFRPTTLASRSDSGKIIVAVLALHKMNVFRGGSSRGKKRKIPVLQQLAEHIRRSQEVVLALTVDGSNGPARVMKPGIIGLACETGAPVFAVHMACKPAIRVPSWDRTRLAMPFGKIVMVIEGPLKCDRDAMDSDKLQELIEQGQLLLDDTAARAEACLATGTLPPPDPRLEIDESYGDRDMRRGRALLLPHEPPPRPRPIDQP